MEILKQYGQASRQLINTEKSSIFFSKNVAEKEWKEVLEELKGMNDVKQSKYLGLPLVIGRSKSQVFDFIKTKVVDTISGWKEKMLSMEAKEILLKSVVMALPAYVMSVCRLPKGLCKSIGREMAKFWWG